MCQTCDVTEIGLTGTGVTVGIDELRCCECVLKLVGANCENGENCDVVHVHVKKPGSIGGLPT